MRRRARGVVATAQALAVLVVVEAGLRTVPLPALCRWLGVHLVLDGPVGAPGALVLDEPARRRARAAERVLRHWPAPPTCLRRSLVTAVVLREHRPVLRLGWRLLPSPAVAHAWLEVDGRSLDRDMTGIEALQGAVS